MLPLKNIQKTYQFMSFIQHQKYLLKYKKYCYPDYLKIPYVRFSNKYFHALNLTNFQYSSTRNLKKKLAVPFKSFQMEPHPYFFLKKTRRLNFSSKTIKNLMIPINGINISPLVKRERFIRNSLKGILLVNFPEKEKNFLIKNLAAENKIPLISQSASLLLKDSRNMDDLLGVDDPIQILFDKVKTCIPCICFINNLDRIGKQRYEQEQKSLHWLNYSISLLINRNLLSPSRVEDNYDFPLPFENLKKPNGNNHQMLISQPISRHEFPAQHRLSIINSLNPEGSKERERLVGFRRPGEAHEKKLLKSLTDLNGLDINTSFWPFQYILRNQRLGSKKSESASVFKNRFRYAIGVPTLKTIPLVRWSNNSLKNTEADFGFLSPNLKVRNHKNKLASSYYHRLPTWLSNCKFVSYSKTNIKKASWFSLYNNVYPLQKEKMIFFPQSATSVAWKLWVFDKSIRDLKYEISKSPIQINFFQTRFSKIKPISKKFKSKMIIPSVSMLKRQRPFVVSRLKQQTAEKKLLTFTESLSTFPNRIYHFWKAEKIRKQEFISIHDPYKSLNELVFKNFLIQSNNFEMLPNKSKPISKINIDSIALPKIKLDSKFIDKISINTKKSLGISEKEPLKSLSGFNGLKINASFEPSRFIPPNPKLASLNKNDQTKSFISTSSQWVKNLEVFFSATVFDSAQARTEISDKYVSDEACIEQLDSAMEWAKNTSLPLNLSKQNITFKTKNSLIKNKNIHDGYSLNHKPGRILKNLKPGGSTTSSLLTDQVRKNNKNNSLNITETDIIKRTALLKFLQILDGFHSPIEKKTIFPYLNFETLKKSNFSEIFLRLPKSIKSKSWPSKTDDKYSLSMKNFRNSLVYRKKLKKDSYRIVLNYIQNKLWFPYGILKAWNRLPKMNRTFVFLQAKLQTSQIECLKGIRFGLFELNKKDYFNQNQIRFLQPKPVYYNKIVQPCLSINKAALLIGRHQIFLKHNRLKTSILPFNPKALPVVVSQTLPATKMILSKEAQWGKQWDKNQQISMFEKFQTRLQPCFLYKKTQMLNRSWFLTFEPILQIRGVPKGEMDLKNQLLNKSLNLLCVWPSYIEDMFGPINLNDSGSYILPEYFQLLGHGPKLKKQGITLIASTNDLTTLDAALLRPGRFDTIINFSYSFSSMDQSSKILKHSASLTQNYKSSYYQSYIREKTQVNLFDRSNQSSLIKTFIDVSIFIQYKLWWSFHNGKLICFSIDKKNLLQEPKISVSNDSKLRTFKLNIYNRLLILPSKIAKLKDLTNIFIGILRMIYLKFFYNIFQFFMIFKNKLSSFININEERSRVLNIFKTRVLKNKNLFTNKTSIHQNYEFVNALSREVLLSTMLRLPLELNEFDFSLKDFKNLEANYKNKTTNNYIYNVYDKDNNMFLKSNRNLLFCTGDFDYKAFTEKYDSIVFVKEKYAKKKKNMTRKKPTVKFESNDTSSYSVNIDNIFLDRPQGGNRSSQTWKPFKAATFKNVERNDIQLTKYSEIYKFKKIKFKQQFFFNLHPFNSLILKRWPEITKSNKLKRYLKFPLIKNILPQFNFPLYQKNQQNSSIIQNFWFLNSFERNSSTKPLPVVSRHAKSGGETALLTMYHNFYAITVLIPTNFSLWPEKLSNRVANDSFFSTYEHYLLKKLSSNSSLNITCVQIYSTLMNLKKTNNWIFNRHLLSIESRLKKVTRKTIFSHKPNAFQNMYKIKYDNVTKDQLKMKNNIILLKNPKFFLISGGACYGKKTEAITWNPNIKKTHDFVKTRGESFFQNYKMCRLDISFFLLTFYTMFFEKIKASTHIPLQTQQWGGTQHKKLTINTIKIFMPYKSLILSHFLLSQSNTYDFSCKNFEILIYNKFKNFFVNF